MLMVFNLRDPNVVQIAASAARQEIWDGSSDVSSSTIQAQRITKLWQEHLCRLDSERFLPEVRISERYREQIDLIDTKDASPTR